MQCNNNNTTGILALQMCWSSYPGHVDHFLIGSSGSDSEKHLYLTQNLYNYPDP